MSLVKFSFACETKGQAYLSAVSATVPKWITTWHHHLWVQITIMCVYSVLKCCQSHNQTSWVCVICRSVWTNVSEEVKHFAVARQVCPVLLEFFSLWNSISLLHSPGFFLSSHISVASQHSLSSSVTAAVSVHVLLL